MENVLIGRVVAVSNVEKVASKTDASKTFERRQIYLDCSRYDSITGERMSDNFPCLEFGGKGLEQLNSLCSEGLKKGDLVSIKFVVQGTTYKDASGNTKNYTGVRTYAIERYVPKTQQQQPASQPVQQSAAPTQTQAPVQQSNSRPTADDLPF